MLRSPFRYIGAKTKLLEWIYSFFPKHKTFVDVFGGTGVVTFNKIPCGNDVYNDINGRIVNFYSVLRDDCSREMLQVLISLTPFSRKEFNDCKQPSDDPIEDARRFYVRQNMSFSGVGRTFGYVKSNANTCLKSFYNRELGGGLSERLKNISFENLPFERIIKNYDSEETLFYLDPPYFETYGTEEYSTDFNLESQNRLIEILKTIKGYAVLSNYQHDTLKTLLDDGWTLHTKNFYCTLNNSEQGKDLKHNKTECIYINPKLNNYLNEKELLKETILC